MHAKVPVVAETSRARVADLGHNWHAEVVCTTSVDVSLGADMLWLSGGHAGLGLSVELGSSRAGEGQRVNKAHAALLVLSVSLGAVGHDSHAVLAPATNKLCSDRAGVGGDSNAGGVGLGLDRACRARLILLLLLCIERQEALARHSLRRKAGWAHTEGSKVGQTCISNTSCSMVALKANG